MSTGPDPVTEKEPLGETINDLTEHVTSYAETFFKLQALKLTQKATDTSARIAGALVVLIMGFFILLFGGLALSWWLGDVLESRALGFLLVAGFFLLVTVILLVSLRGIIFPKFRNLIIRKFYD